MQQDNHSKQTSNSRIAYKDKNEGLAVALKKFRLKSN